jgi:hypothetical protein
MGFSASLQVVPRPYPLKTSHFVQIFSLLFTARFDSVKIEIGKLSWFQSRIILSQFSTNTKFTSIKSRIQSL